MKSNWDDVIDIYQRDPSFHMEKITKSGQTALHIAVSDVQEQKVAKLVDIIIKHPTKTDESTIADHHKTAASKIDKAEARFPALAVEDDRGNTPLHIAASLGSAKMCECIAWANKDSSLELIGARNHDGYEYCRKNDGDTILHSAISGDYFDLAFQIIHLYKRLANYVNEQGLTPLHILLLMLNKTTSLELLADPDRIVAFYFLSEASHDAKLLMTTANLRRYGFFNVDATLEPPSTTMPPKMPGSPRRKKFSFPRARIARMTEAAPSGSPVERATSGSARPTEAP
ncbi:uncharacterized protein LOC116125335 [Pistacia vera]|uniref:uncharacterized protein LOC116125335 n=1 Tax=Pistacia vera TaxID=55513 RepID=UPI001263447A|nr:uncharacterized protein LOC116125335 [Pistacia vera]